MFRTLFHKVDLWIVRSVKSARDEQETLLRKKIWWGLCICWIFFSSYDLLVSLSTQNEVLMLINAAGGFLSILLLVSFYKYRNRIEIFGLLLQLIIILQTSAKIYILNGIFHATGVVFAGLIGPIYALTFPSNRRAILMFLLYLGLIISSTLYREWSMNSEILQDPHFRYRLWRFTGGISVIFSISWVYSAQLAKLKRLEEERLIQLHQAKSKLYTNITHEFRTPLTVILGMADSIEREPKLWLNKGVGLIRSNADKLLTLVNQLLTMSKLEADSMPVNFIQSDIIPYIRYILESFTSMADEKSIRLHFLSRVNDLTMDFDPEIIEDIVGNLVSNAIKYTLHGGDVYLQIENSEELILVVQDNGVGIAQDKLPYIFNRFYQADDDTTRKAEGTGIGLALVKEYVQLLNGSIQVNSIPNKGTEFSLSIPIHHSSVNQGFNHILHTKNPHVTPSESNLTDKPLRTEVPPKNNGELPILLIIEDNNDVVEYLKTVLIPNYQIEVAVDGDQGINQALTSIPDLILCDVMMPVKDGYDVCKTLKQNFRTNHIPIVILTARADIDSRISGLEYGADAYLTKPFNRRELLVRIQKLIELRHKLIDKYSQAIYTSPDIVKPKGLNETFLYKLLENLNKNYHDENYGIDRICDDTGISRTQLHRKLIALTGKSTSDFIRNFRIMKAKELLLSTDISVSEIAYQVGFKDPNYFTKSFAKEMGYTPSQYRSEKYHMKQ